MKCGNSDTRNEEYFQNYSDEEFFKLMLPKEDPIILDVGAHKGESHKFFKSIFPAAKVVCLEPDPDSFEALVKNIPAGEMAINAALSDKRGSTNFYRYEVSHLNSLIPINASSNDSIGFAKKAAAEKVLVQCLTLSDLLSSIDLGEKQVDLLKMDVQGSEVDIISSSPAALKKINNITLEINLFDFYQVRNSFFALEKHLRDFELYAITKLSQNPKNFRTDWAEVFYKRKEQV